MNLRNIKLRDIMSFIPGARPSFLGIRGLSRTWGIFGLIALGVGVLAYPTLMLVRAIRSRRLLGLESVKGTFKNFAPSLRGKHKPHHRKVESETGLNPGLS
jgi:hypothetical protein